MLQAQTSHLWKVSYAIILLGWRYTTLWFTGIKLEVNNHKGLWITIMLRILLNCYKREGKITFKLVIYCTTSDTSSVEHPGLPFQLCNVNVYIDPGVVICTKIPFHNVMGTLYNNYCLWYTIHLLHYGKNLRYKLTSCGQTQDQTY